MVSTSLVKVSKEEQIFHALFSNPTTKLCLYCGGAKLSNFMYRPENACLIKGDVDTNPSTVLNANTFCFVSLTRVVIMDRTDYTEKNPDYS